MVNDDNIFLSLPVVFDGDKSVDAFNNNGIRDKYQNNNCYLSSSVSNDNNIIFLLTASKDYNIRDNLNINLTFCCIYG